LEKENCEMAVSKNVLAAYRRWERPEYRETHRIAMKASFARRKEEQERMRARLAELEKAEAERAAAAQAGAAS
jgi:hypothetical protein